MAKLTKVEIRDVAMAFFYAFSSCTKGNMVKELDMKFRETMPYIDLNVFSLSDELRQDWKEFSMYVGSLCERERDIELLD